ncbi:hypothetical protein MA16_Dca005777 [Dendrobium catenatum]|uniref:Uncharacterized protein n=1 Tax=Dendrobium catenatum TaxID=906689 RepID=A0A2I0WX62_9ASPA|nr:hypothetical protein MA16_Dca005777 [Dendrobium catenatum]
MQAGRFKIGLIVQDDRMVVPADQFKSEENCQEHRPEFKLADIYRPGVTKVFEQIGLADPEIVQDDMIPNRPLCKFMPPEIATVTKSPGKPPVVKLTGAIPVAKTTGVNYFYYRQFEPPVKALKFTIPSLPFHPISCSLSLSLAALVPSPSPTLSCDRDRLGYRRAISGHRRGPSGVRRTPHSKDKVLSQLPFTMPSPSSFSTLHSTHIHPGDKEPQGVKEEEAPAPAPIPDPVPLHQHSLVDQLIESYMTHQQQQHDQDIAWFNAQFNTLAGYFQQPPPPPPSDDQGPSFFYVSEGFEVLIPSILVLEGAKNILEQEKWVNAETVNSSDDLVVVLDVGDVVSSKPVGDVVSYKSLEIIHNDVIETDVGFSTVNHNEFPPINVVPVNAFSDQRQRNSSTVEDGVLFLEGDNSTLDPSGGEMNNEILSDHYICDAYTDTEI